MSPPLLGKVYSVPGMCALIHFRRTSSKSYRLLLRIYQVILFILLYLLFRAQFIISELAVVFLPSQFAVHTKMSVLVFVHLCIKYPPLKVFSYSNS